MKALVFFHRAPIACISCRIGDREQEECGEKPLEALAGNALSGRGARHFSGGLGQS